MGDVVLLVGAVLGGGRPESWRWREVSSACQMFSLWVLLRRVLVSYALLLLLLFGGVI